MALKDVLKEEMIGEVIEVTSSGNKTLIGLRGRVIDESKNTIILDTKKGKKTLLKDQVIFIVEKKGKKLKIDGKKICFRPEDRIKRVR